MKKELSFSYALFTVILSFSVIMIPAVFLGARTQPLFLISWMIAIPLCMRLGYTYKELQTGLMTFAAKSLVPMTIVLCVGALIGTWNACGTAGVALMGVGLSMGINPLIIAAPIIGGAYFGDAISPLSDSTNVAAGTVGIDLFDSIKYQAITTLPAALICGVIYFMMGRNVDYSMADITVINEVVKGIDSSYKLGIIPLIPMVVVLIMLLKKVPSIPSILSGSISGFLVAWLYQGQSFKNVVQSMWGGFVLNSDNAFIKQIFSRGGITSMSGTAFLFVFAFGLFGILNTAGIIDKVVEPLTKKVKGRLGGTICTVILGFISNITSASGNFSFVFTGSLMTPVYEKANLSKWDLTRAMSVGCLLSGLLVPWNSNPLTVTGFLGVDTIDMLPYMFTPLVTAAVLFVVTGLNLDKKFKK
jgi:NhaC family Na+:H+ antiporter